jgi:phospholipase C
LPQQLKFHLALSNTSLIVVQENRTPDNLFGVHAPPTANNCGTLGDFPGADIVSTGVGNTSNGTNYPCNATYPMNSNFSPMHENADWKADYHSGANDNFCDTARDGYTAPCPTYSNVRINDVAAYFSIATTYGFANYMFQSNEGPSFEAHQFLFTGTAAPYAPNTNGDYYEYFVENNPPANSGCPVALTDLYWIDPAGNENKNPPLQYECYAHDSLVTSAAKCSNGSCDNGVTWRYYAPAPGNIWTAPESIPEVCYGVNDLTHQGTNCGTLTNSTWGTHMKFYSTMNNAPIFTDIAACGLQQISWVIPDAAWSDHPEINGGPALGPSWVADIVNAIGNTSVSGSGNCNYWGSGTNTNSIEPTAIFIVWDDWGGFYDHVNIKPYVYPGSGVEGSFSCPAPATNNWGCGYTHGFRVPFLVVSEYTGGGTIANPTGYISGECGVTGYPNCPNTSNAKYLHDFGSILNFTEYNFGLSKIAPPGYADNNALDNVSGNISLSDFFGLYVNSTTPGRAFIPISTNYPTGFFQTYYNTHSPTGPDSD